MTSNGSHPRPLGAVILAAGRGSRLSDAPDAPPKPLTRLQGRPLIEYGLDALQAAGIRDALVVTGHRAAEVQAVVEARESDGLRIFFVHNPAFNGPASRSLRSAREWCGDVPFLLLMSDHVPSPEFLQRFLDGVPPGIHCVAVDRGGHEPAYIDEATRVCIDPAGNVTDIGKGLPAWDALDAGAFLLQPSAWEAIEAAPLDCELSVIFGRLATTSALRAVDITGAFWYDIDTAADLAAASELLERVTESQGTGNREQGTASRL